MRCQWKSFSLSLSIYIYDPSAWTPNSLFNAIIVLQSFCNLCFAIFCYAILAILQSLLCNCCYAILAMQSLLCNLCYAIFAMQPLLCNLCFPLFFELRLQKNLGKTNIWTWNCIWRALFSRCSATTKFVDGRANLSCCWAPR